MDIEFEFTPGATVTPPRSHAVCIRSDIAYDAAATFAVTGVIDDHEYSAVVYRSGGLDLYQPDEGADQRAKKTLYIASPQRLTTFLGAVESLAREYYGSDWGKDEI